ncbi:MAG TPA: acyltransferase family protein [Dehalococcoidia bacterium]|nr:acyltransferase family protein [Dehalococcoidia bacterium]
MRNGISMDGRGLRITYMPALDGVRGLAVAGVLAYHGGLSWARGGFLGVDAFLVLSGYLITTLLLVEGDARDGIDLRAFWMRRARRLLPALFVLIAGVAAYAALLAEPHELSGIRADAFATVAYVANWRQVLAGDSYFEQFGAPSPFLHTWSLAIEEQWYVLWPLALALALRARARPRMLLALCIALALASAALMALLHAPGEDLSRVYYGTDTRAQSLLVGAALAVALSMPAMAAALSRRRHALQGAAIAAAAMLAWAWHDATGSTDILYRGGFLVLALCVAIIIAATIADAGGAVARVLRLAPLRWAGVVSYGVYLYHWPLFLVLTPERTGLDGYALFAVRCAASVSAAAVSHWLIEDPVRRGRIASRVPVRVAVPGAAAAAAAVIVAVMVTTQGATEQGAPTADARAAPPPAARDTTRVLVVGDSVAFTLGRGLERAATGEGLAVWNQGRLGCGLLRGEAVLVDGRWTETSPDCTDWEQRWRAYVDAFQPDVAVVLPGAWDLHDREVGGRRLAFGTPESDAFAASELEAAIDVLSAEGARVMLVTMPPFQQPDLGVAAASPRFDTRRIDAINRIYERVADEHPDTVTLFDLAGSLRLVSARGMADPTLSPDGVHFTDAGADKLARAMLPAIHDAGAARERDEARAPGAAETGGPWTDMLRLVPSTGDSRALTVINDYERFRRSYGITPPPAAAGADDMMAYYRALTFDAAGSRTGLVPAPVTGLAGTPRDLDRPAAELGMPLGHVDQDAWTRGGAFQVLRGRTDDGGSAGAMRTAFAGDSPAGATLADHADFAEMARALERLPVYSALFSADVAPFSVEAASARLTAGATTDEQRRLAVAALSPEHALAPYAAYAAAAGIDGRGAFTAVVLVHGTDAGALKNAGRLAARIEHARSFAAGQPFSDLVEGSTIQADGRIIVVMLRVRAAGYWYALHAVHDTLLVHD